MRVDFPLVGDLDLVLKDMAPFLAPTDLSPWIEEIEGYKRRDREFSDPEPRADNATTMRGATGEALPSPKEILEAVGDVFPDAVITTEVGQNQMWAAQFLPFSKPRRWLTSGGLGTMGYGFPAAIGAKAGKPRDDVVVIAGDGSFQMNIQELATCVQEDLPVIVVILNNGYLGMVRQWQELFHDRRYSSTCLQAHSGCPKGCNAPGERCPFPSPDFAGIAKAYGAEGYRAATLSEFRAAASAARDSRRPAVIDCRIAREENVWPIVAPGKGNDQMLYKGVSV